MGFSSSAPSSYTAFVQSFAPLWRRGSTSSSVTSIRPASVARSSWRMAASRPSIASISDLLRDPKWPPEWPYVEENFRRQDETNDDKFYDQPRLVYHIDNFAVDALTKYYASLPVPDAALDFASSWVSHYPEYWTKTASRIAAMGMNESELRENKIATEFAVKDLNQDPTFPYGDNTFDIVTNCVSVDYLIRPLEVFREVARVLRPGGRAIFSFSNRCFPTKAIMMWLQTSDLDHVYIVGSYFHYAGGFEPAEAIDLTPPFMGLTDPLYVVTACKTHSS